ncbi:MAG: CPBP family intramembrane metalloprotease [Clostridiales bacterium]|nr:CPBP family intramembrane metalloprotease [Clostridiales bacterium]
MYALVIGGVSALIIAGSDKFIFEPYLPEGTLTFTFSLDYFIASILYGGIIEEVLLRLFMMSLIVFLIAKITRTSSESLTGKKGIYVTAIVLAAVLFALGHLPATIQLLGVSVPIIIRMFLLNGLAGIGFGYLYWKKGLNHAMLAHMMTHVFVQLVFMPLLF